MYKFSKNQFKRRKYNTLKILSKPDRQDLNQKERNKYKKKFTQKNYCNMTRLKVEILIKAKRQKRLMLQIQHLLIMLLFQVVF